MAEVGRGSTLKRAGGSWKGRCPPAEAGGKQKLASRNTRSDLAKCIRRENGAGTTPLKGLRKGGAAFGGGAAAGGRTGGRGVLVGAVAAGIEDDDVGILGGGF